MSHDFSLRKTTLTAAGLAGDAANQAPHPSTKTRNQHERLGSPPTWRRTRRTPDLARVLALALWAFALPAQAASNGPSEGVEAAYLPASTPAYKSVMQPRFRFRFDIPQAWRAVDRSSNGDGFFLDTGDASVDARVYGSYADAPDNRAGRQRFTFADGRTGWQETSPTHVHYVRKAGDRWLSVYVKAPPSWRAQHADEMAQVARSLRPTGSPSVAKRSNSVTPPPPPPPGSAASRPS